MAQSTITSKNQTTVPREIRERLRVGPSDVLIWEIVDRAARVSPASRRFLELRGSIRVGPGSPVETSVTSSSPFVTDRDAQQQEAARLLERAARGGSRSSSISSSSVSWSPPGHPRS